MAERRYWWIALDGMGLVSETQLGLGNSRQVLGYANGRILIRNDKIEDVRKTVDFDLHLFLTWFGPFDRLFRKLRRHSFPQMDRSSA
jgi:hypothetical protein